MGAPIGQLSELLVYATPADLPDDGQQEVGNVAVTAQPPGLHVWAGTSWAPVGPGVDLSERVARLEERLHCLGECLAADA